ncbi:glycogen synthase GlgA [Paenibacillus xanthanilyticus]|uniref:Glycogen synthase n=1 Tax=Paenibacillus xanthanilyticus TaxID=1783531 RepID=A0ABV8K4L8_9BACL
MKLLFVASEAVPLAKTGGLADVAGSLPKALKERGVDAGVIMPKYGSIPDSAAAQMIPLATFTVWVGWRQQYCGLLKADIEGVTYYFIDNEYYFKRGGLYGYDDDPERFVFFSIAVIEALRFLETPPDILHCHDWQSALVPYLLRTKYGHVAEWASIGTVFTIHNLKYQGVLGTQQLMDLVGMGDEIFGYRGLEYYGAANMMKGALEYADKLTTVSPTYAEEIQTAQYGEGLDGLLRHRAADLAGIVNGIDTVSFDPMNDPALVTPFRNSLAKKRRNKLALQRELGLPESESTPLIGIVSRLVDQKGFDLVAAVLGELLNEEVQLVVLGSGDPHYEGIFRHATESRPDKIKVWFGFNDSLARRIYAGSDMYLMPSLFEPCGLSQLLALRYRSVPIVRETGGLRDTVRSYEEGTGEGNGFSFAWYNAHDMLYTIRRALGLYRDEKTWEKIVSNGVKEDYSWSKSAKAYMALYQELVSRRKAAELSGVN